VVAHRKRRNALQALDLYCRFLEQQGLEQLQGGLSPIAAALSRGDDQQACEWWRRYKRTGLRRRGLEDQMLVRYDVLRRNVQRAMAHLRMYLDHRFERPLIDLSEETINRQVAQQAAVVERRMRRRRRRQGWMLVTCLLALAAVWLAF
jgi:hypothetical protein